jgi:hypothetical protein
MSEQSIDARVRAIRAILKADMRPRRRRSRGRRREDRISSAVGDPTLPTKREALAIAKETGNAVLARDGRYHTHTDPERQARLDLWLAFKDHLWALGDGTFDAAAIVAAVPPYQVANFHQRLVAGQELLARIRAAWEAERPSP